MSNQLTNNFDTSKIFIWDNRYQPETITNSSYDEVTLEAGTLVGRVTATGAIVACRSDSADGSQIPLGILKSEHVIPAGDSVETYICIAGDVAEEKVVFFKAGDTAETIVDGRRYKDRIEADTMGIKLVPGTELTSEDNQ